MTETKISNEVDILLVEDNSSDAELTIRALKKQNLANKLIHVTDGAAALDFVFGKGKYENRPLETGPKIILLDLKMPKVSGIEVLRKLKADEKTKLIPVVILTSSKEEPDITECYELGINSYIVKPVEFDKFIHAIAEIGFYWLLLNQPPQR
jgi:two-component system, response regulator